MLIRYILFFLFILQFTQTLKSQSLTDYSIEIDRYYSEKYPDISVEYSILDIIPQKRNNIILVYIQQEVNGIPIFNSVSTAIFRKSTLLDIRGNIEKEAIGKKGKIKNYDLEQTAREYFAQKTTSKQAQFSQKTREVSFYSEYFEPTHSSEALLLKKVIYKNNKEFIPCIEIAQWIDEKEVWENTLLHAETLQPVYTFSWTVECNHASKECSQTCDMKSNTAIFAGVDSSYHCLAFPVESPLYGSRTIEIEPWLQAANASPFGWHDLDGIAGVDTTVTFGNNVKAYDDTDDDNLPGLMPDGGDSLCFDFPFDDSQNPSTYLEAAVVNLFYANNVIHDILFQYGFDEENGNFQGVNYSGNGSGNDYVNAEAQDGGGNNNANFSTPPDGTNPRMQMYNWTFTTADTMTVLSPPAIVGDYIIATASFGPKDTLITDTLVLADPVLACEPLTNAADITGQIAMIDRGTCTFVQKVLQAQNAGAVAAIICNNQTNGVFAMGGNDPNIVIPSVMLSKTDCDLIKLSLPDVEVTLNIGPSNQHDSDMDNGVIIHEYGHGVSTRLTGGPAISSCLNNDEQMGEGWSDYLAMMLTIESGDLGTDSRGMANYLVGEDENGGGIRPHPYSTDMSINPHTYADISSVSIPHGVGSVWCAMLWDMTWLFIDQYGYDANFYSGTGGNNIALQLVIDGLKLQPCSPGFVDGRDAILLADELYNGGVNSCLIWEAFAGRGLGYSASQGSSGSVTDGVEAFDLPPVCQEILAVVKSGEETVFKKDTIHYSLFAFNYSGNTLANVTLEDQIPLGLNYIDGSVVNGTETAGLISQTWQTLENGDEETITFEAVIADTTTTISWFNGVEDEGSLFTVMPQTGSSTFTISTVLPHQGMQSWFIQNVGADNTHYLLMPQLTIQTDDALSFYHWYHTEIGWDGGFVEYSTDGGNTWMGLEEYFVLNGYNSILGESSNSAIFNKPAFSGESEGYINSIVHLGHLAGQSVTLRFGFGSDNNTFDIGWYIDNIAMVTVPQFENIACIEDVSNIYCDTLTTSVVPDCTDIYILYADSDSDGFGGMVDSIFSCYIPVNGYVDISGDCDDSNADIHPNVEEICDGMDNNCDGNVDEICSGSLVCQDDILYIVDDGVMVSVAQILIDSDAFIDMQDSTWYYAGDTISLQPGFEVISGKQFEAIIEDCVNGNE